MLSVVHEDSLKAKPTAAASLEGMAPEQRADHALLKPDDRFGLSGTLDPEKQAAFTRIREGGFDLVIGNPPYVAEANNKPLFERLRQIDAWKEIYKGKTDYLYYFLSMAAELVVPGGRLCVIVPAAWMNAGNADWLREKLASTLRLDELFLFGSYRLFAPAEGAAHRGSRAQSPTVESAILLATKADVPKGHKLRVVVLEDDVEVARVLSGDVEARVPEREPLLAEMSRRAAGRQGRKGGILVHDIKQADLDSSVPWPVKQGAKDVGPRVVAHLGRAAQQSNVVKPLDEFATIVRGVETGADAFTPRIKSRLKQSFPDSLKVLEAGGVELGDPIMELPPGAETASPWKDHQEDLARSVEPGAILYAALNENDYTSLVWLDRTDKPAGPILKALEVWRPVLESRAEIARNPVRRWWECLWTRDKDMLRRPKVIALYRTDRGRFAVDEAGEWQPSNKTTLVIPRQEDLSVTYLGGLLNSELLDLWYAVRGKTPWHVRRNYEPKRMKEIPYRHVETGVVDGKRIDALRGALRKGEAKAAAKQADAIAADLREQGDEGLAADAPRAVLAGRALEEIVRAIAENRRALLPLRDRFPALGRVVKDPWCTERVQPDPRAFVARLPKKKRASVRVDPDLKVSVETDGAIGRGELVDGALIFAHRRQPVARVTGPREKLMLLGELLGERRKLMPADLRAEELPRDIDSFRTEVEAVTGDATALLVAGRVLVEAAERLVCALYAVPAELEEDVIAHAVARADKASARSE